MFFFKLGGGTIYCEIRHLLLYQLRDLSEQLGKLNKILKLKKKKIKLEHGLIAGEMSGHFLLGHL